MTLVHADANTVPSAVLVEAKKGAAPSLILTPPLLLYRPSDGSNSRTLTDDAADIYEDCSFTKFFSKKG